MYRLINGVIVDINFTGYRLIMGIVVQGQAAASSTGVVSAIAGKGGGIAGEGGIAGKRGGIAG